MWRSYRLYSGLFLLLWLVAASRVDGARKTRPDSSNSIADDTEDTPDAVLNDQLLPTLDNENSQSSNRSSENNADEDWQGSGDVESSILSLPDAASSDNNSTTITPDWNTTWPYFNTGCLQWLPINHVYFQLANSFLFLSYLAPAGLYGLLYLRLMLAIGSAFFAIWGWVILCAFDTFLWNAVFFLINLVHGIYILFTLRPVRFDKQVEEVYKNIFQPLKVSKQQFKKVVNCMKAIRPLKRGEHFAVEKQTRVETLSLLLSGSMLVLENTRTLQVLHPMQFLDSPEWFGVSSDDFFQVSIRACEESRVLLWHRDKLKLILLSDPFLQAVFDHILGRDVVRKLTQMKEKIASPSGSSPFRNNLINNGSFIESEKSPGLHSKSSMHEHGLVVAPEQLSLLDENVAKKVKNRSGTPSSSSSIRQLDSHSGSPTGRYDYSIVQHLDSTDI